MNLLQKEHEEKLKSLHQQQEDLSKNAKETEEAKDLISQNEQLSGELQNLKEKMQSTN